MVIREAGLAGTSTRNLGVKNKYLQAASRTKRKAQDKLVEAILPVQLRVRTIGEAEAKAMGGFSYLITGDTESDRWGRIDGFFGAALKAHVLAAAHHGSKNAVHVPSLLHIDPHTVLISAGVNNQYGHPDPVVVKVYKGVAKQVFSTNMEGGVALLTQPGTAEFTTTLIPS